MSWNNVDNPNKKEIDKRFVSCDERNGKEKNKFKEYEREYAKEAVDYCCKNIKGNKPREEFEKCLKNFNK